MGNSIQTSTKNRFRKEYFTRNTRKRELDNVQFLRSPSPLEKNCMVPLLGGSKAGHCCLSSEILNILYDRNGPNPGFWCLMSFEHLDSDT